MSNLFIYNGEGWVEISKDGADGNKIEPQEIVDKLESLIDDERLDISAVRGTESLIEVIAKKIAKDEVKKVKKEYIGGGGGSSSSGGTGDVVGPASAVDGNFALFDTTTGKLIKDGGTSLSAFALDLAGLHTSKQDTLVSGTNIKTINGNSLLGSGDIIISGGAEQDTLDVTTSQSVNTNQFIRADTTNGSITLTLINPATKQTVTIKKIDSTSNSVYVYSTSLIDGSTTAEISMENESITLKWTGTTYDIT